MKIVPKAKVEPDKPFPYISSHDGWKAKTHDNWWVCSFLLHGAQLLTHAWFSGVMILIGSSFMNNRREIAQLPYRTSKSPLGHNSGSTCSFLTHLPFPSNSRFFYQQSPPFSYCLFPVVNYFLVFSSGKGQYIVLTFDFLTCEERPLSLTRSKVTWLSGLSLL